MRVIAPERLTIAHILELREMLLQLPVDADDVDVDLSAVVEVDTAGLQWLLMAKRLPGKHVRFVGHSTTVVEVIELTHLGQALGDPIILAPVETT